MKATSYDRRLKQKSYIMLARNNFSLNHQNFALGKTWYTPPSLLSSGGLKGFPKPPVSEPQSFMKNIWLFVNPYSGGLEVEVSSEERIDNSTDPESASLEIS